MSENSNSSYDLVPELGDFVSIVSDVYKLTTGRIIYRDNTLIRIRPLNASHKAVDFPLVPETGLFQETLGVTELLIHEKRTTPHFSRQLSTVIGEHLDFFHADGTPSDETGVVLNIFATSDTDGIQLEDGRVLDFGFIGSKSPNDVVRPRAAPEDIAPPENNSVLPIVEEEVEEAYPEIDLNTLPAALVEEVPTQERTYSDSVQREDMFVSMLVDIPLKRQKDPRVMQELYRITDILLALKNSVVLRDEAGNVAPGSRSYTATTLRDTIERQPTGQPVSALLPVVAVKKVLYIDSTDEDVNLDKDDIEVRSDTRTLLSALDTSDFARQSTGNAFVTHIHKTLQGLAAYVPKTANRIQTRIDQDVLCTKLPYEPIEGFPETPPAYTKDFYGRAKTLLPLTLDFLGEVQNRFSRMLSASTIRNTKTNATYTVSPADSGETLGYVLLSEPLVAYRAPIRSQVLIWDIAHSEYSRRSQNYFERTFAKTRDAQTILTDTDSHNITEIIQKRLHPTTSFMNYETSQLYDTLGLRDLEFTDDLLKPLDISLKVGQRLWDMSKARRVKDADAASKDPSVPPIAAAVANFTTHIIPTEAYPIFTEALKKLVARETSLANYDFAVVEALSRAGGQTFAAYWNTILGDSPKARIERAERTYIAETLRESQNDARTKIIAKAFVATPDINTCPHVAELERIYSIRSDEQRMVMFEKCYKNYQAGQHGNYILCGTCGKDFVCKHEILLLNEFLHPGRGTALHKSLLLEYAGPVFEGAYICKVCGQKIRDIEYDTHLEFDDEGRPLVGRNIVEKDEEDETDIALVIREEVVDALPFTGEELVIYYMARTICEQCGLTYPLDTYRRIVQGYTSFFEKIPQRDPYEKKRKEAEKVAKKGAIIPAPYDNFIATYQVAGLSALILLELQTSTVTPPTTIANCVFRRDGFPLDDAKTVGTGALNYITCVVANIMRNDKPWNLTSWSAETNMPKRITLISNATKLIVERILALGSGVPPLNITDMYRTRLEDERQRKVTTGTNREMRASDADTLPISFRPLQRIVLPASINEKPVGNVSRFLGSVATAPIAEMRSFVDTRSEQLALHLLDDSHKASQKTAEGQVPKRSDATCCFTKLADVARRGLGVVERSTNEAYKKEYELQSSAKTSLENRDPASSFSGTHFYVPWSAPAQSTVVPGADPSMYYKIFMKHCYKGDRYGYPHEITANHVCRRCEFPYPVELDMLDTSDPNSSKRREELSLVALAAVEINEDSYTRLDRQIKQIKTIPQPPPQADTNFLSELGAMGGFLTDILMPGDIDTLITTMAEIQGKGLKDVARRAKFADVSKRYDAARTAFAECFTAGTTVLQGIETLTDTVIGSVAVRNLIQVFVVQGTQIAYEFKCINPNGRKWFHSISLSHQTLLNKIWNKSAETVVNTISLLDELNESKTKILREILTKFTETYSHVYDTWIRELRSNIHFTDDEYKIVLRWFTLSGLTALMKRDSVYYRDIPTAEEKNSVSQFLTSWIDASVQSYTKYNKRYQLNVSQIQEAINARAELEKAYFIKRFDDLDKDLRMVEKIKKNLKIGDWAVGTVKNLFSYDANFYEFERSQRAAMGLPEFGGGEESAGTDHRQETIDGGYDNRAAQDEDV